LTHYHKLSFPKAVELLAETTQTPLPQQQSPTTASATWKQTNPQVKQSQPSATEKAESFMPKLKKDPIYQQIFNLAAQFYHQQLF